MSELEIYKGMVNKMKDDEIKEILDYFKDDIEFLEKELINTNFLGRYITIRDKECGYLKKLLDYITNLQQENERLKVKYNEEKSHQINYNYFETLYSKSTKEIVIDDLVWKCEELDNFKKEYEKLYIGKEDYKSRCEKAVEYLKKPRGNYYRDLNYEPIKVITLINILNGRSDE